MASPTQQDDSTATPSANEQDLASLWWNTNVPPEQQTPDCPSYLQYALSKPKELDNLSTPDADFALLSWPEVKDIISSNRLDFLRRVPSELRLYRKFTEDVINEWGSVEKFMRQGRLGWKGIDAYFRQDRFERESHYKILPNDWPYGLSPSISHLVVWTKFPLDWDNPGGSPNYQSSYEIELFIDEKFRKYCGEDNVVWFRNPGHLRSVEAVEHFHVLVNEPPFGFVWQLTGGEVPMSERGAGDVNLERPGDKLDFGVRERRRKKREAMEEEMREAEMMGQLGPLD